MEESAINEILIQLFGGWPLTYRRWNETQFNLEATVKNLSASGVEALFKFFALERLEDNTKYVLFVSKEKKTFGKGEASCLFFTTLTLTRSVSF